MASAPSLRLCPRVLLVPVDADAVVPPGDGTLVLRVVRGTAFGDGSHPTTRLCARAVDLWCRQRTGPFDVLDVGTGTGVLARMARAHGARHVVGTDIDPQALDESRRNTALDPHPVHITDASPGALHRAFTLVVANILEPVLLALADELVGAVEADGTLMLSGFTAVQAPVLVAAMEARGLHTVTRAELEGWMVLVFHRPP